MSRPIAPLALALAPGLLLAAAAGPASADELRIGSERGYVYAYAGYQRDGRQEMRTEQVTGERVTGEAGQGAGGSSVAIDTTAFLPPADARDAFVGGAVGVQFYFSGGQGLAGGASDYVLRGEASASGGFEGSGLELQVVMQKGDQPLGERPTFSSLDAAFRLPAADAAPQPFEVRLSDLRASGPVDLSEADELQVVLVCNGALSRLGNDADNRITLAAVRLEGPFQTSAGVAEREPTPPPAEDAPPEPE